MASIGPKSFLGSFQYCMHSWSVQEISSLVGEVKTESSEAEAVVMVTTAMAEEEEPMQTDPSSGHVESTAASVLQVHVEASEAAAQVLTYTHTHACTHTHTLAHR